MEDDKTGGPAFPVDPIDDIAHEAAMRIINETCCNRSMDHRAKLDWAETMRPIIVEAMAKREEDVAKLVEAAQDMLPQATSIDGLQMVECCAIYEDGTSYELGPAATEALRTALRPFQENPDATA